MDGRLSLGRDREARYAAPGRRSGADLGRQRGLWFPRLLVLRRQGRSGTADCTRSGNGWATQWSASCCCSGWY